MALIDFVAYIQIFVVNLSSVVNLLAIRYYILYTALTQYNPIMDNNV